MLTNDQGGYGLVRISTRPEPDEAELRTEFARQHEGSNLDVHKLRGTYRRADIAALWSQHCRTAKWMASRCASSCHASLSAGVQIQERAEFEKAMHYEGVADFARRPSGRYENMVLEWHWLGWRARARAQAGP